MNYAEALIRHSMLKDCNNRFVGQQVHQDALAGAWAAATATPDNGTAMASSIRTAIPLDYIPLFRSFDSLPAAYFVSCIADSMTELSPTPSDLGDMLYCANLATRAIALFEKRRQQADTMEEGFGCDRSQAWAILRKCDDRSAKATKKMEKIAKLAGRMFNAMQYEGIPKPSNDPLNVTGVTSGDDVGRLLAEEVATLGVDGLNADTVSRLEEHQTLELDMSGETTKSRGPLVIALDESGSMHERRQIWSKACAVALARVALNEGRKVRVVHWSTGSYVQDLDANDPDDLRELAWMHLGGGTDVDMAMELAVRECGDLAADGFSGADIVFVTDGEASYDEGPFIEMKQKGIQLWTIAIDVDLRKKGGYYGDQKPHLHDYAAKYIHVNERDLGGTAGAEELKDAALDNDSLN